MISAEDLLRMQAELAAGQWLSKADSKALVNEVEQIPVLRATITQQAAWLREVTQERDVLKLRVAELERKGDEQQEGIRFLEKQLATTQHHFELCMNDWSAVVDERDVLKLRVAELERERDYTALNGINHYFKDQG